MMAAGHPQMILGACRDRMHEIKVSLDGFTIRRSQSVHPDLEESIFIATILKIPKLQDYLGLAVVVRELSQAPMCFLFDCCIFIARFTSLSCYSSAKTRIRPIKLYQINESFCSVTCCALLHLVYCLIAVLMHLQCPELQVCMSSSPRCFFFKSEPEPEPEPALELHFLNFSIAFSHHVFVHDITVLTLRTCKSMQVPFNICEFLQLFNKFIKPY